MGCLDPMLMSTSPIPFTALEPGSTKMKQHGHNMHQTRTDLLTRDALAAREDEVKKLRLELQCMNRENGELGW